MTPGEICFLTPLELIFSGEGTWHPQGGQPPPQTYVCLKDGSLIRLKIIGFDKISGWKFQIRMSGVARNLFCGVVEILEGDLAGGGGGFLVLGSFFMFIAPDRSTMWDTHRYNDVKRPRKAMCLGQPNEIDVVEPSWLAPSFYSLKKGIGFEPTIVILNQQIYNLTLSTPPTGTLPIAMLPEQSCLVLYPSRPCLSLWAMKIFHVKPWTPFAAQKKIKSHVFLIKNCRKKWRKRALLFYFIYPFFSL